jgi:hypothetical protein
MQVLYRSKARHSLSLADAWIAGAAQQVGATLPHQDPEFRAIANRPPGLVDNDGKFALDLHPLCAFSSAMPRAATIGRWLVPQREAGRLELGCTRFTMTC